MLTARHAAAALLLVLSPAFVRSQTSSPDQTGVPNKQSGSVPVSATDAVSATGPTPVAKKTDESELRQTKRIFGVIPNYTAVSADIQVPTMTVRDKFTLAMHDSVDHSSFILVGVLAGYSMATNANPEFHHGVPGYGRYYWRAFADQASGTFFTEAIIPVITHEDPRYYTLGHGGFFRRSAYALSRVVVTETDSGGTGFNYSEIVGNAMEAGLSNLYNPAEERGFGKTAKNWATQTLVTGAANVLKEFWPDIRHHVLRRK